MKSRTVEATPAVDTSFVASGIAENGESFDSTRQRRGILQSMSRQAQVAE